VVVVLFQHRTMWLEYWLTQDCVVVVLFQPMTSFLEYCFTLGCKVGVQVDTGLCGLSTGLQRDGWWECLC